jgi:tetratricopeptide (TPR) repeat protein
MFRYLVLLSSCLLCDLGSVAQNRVEQPTGLTLNYADLHSSKTSSARSLGAVDARISIQRLKVPRKARQLYEKALEAWGKHAGADAQQKVDQALQLDPGFPEALTLLGGIRAANQQRDAAEQCVQAAIRSDPDYPPAYVILAGIYNTQQRYEEAEQAAEHALQAGAATWSVQYEIARALIGQEKYENAIAISDAALLSNHGSLMHLARAHAMLGLQRYPEAEAELRAYLRDDPEGEGSENARELLERLQSLGSR